MMPNASPGTHQIEQHTIYQIPLDQRHGKGSQLFTLWFGANMQLGSIVTGSLGTTVFAQSYLSAVVAILIGNFVGAIFMALHAAQGPHLGVPQMVQSRGQFGSRGAAVVVALVILMYVGYFASGIVLGGQALRVVGGVDERIGIFAIGLLALIATVYGHDLIHLYTRAMTYLAGVALVVSFAWIFLVTGLPASFAGHGSFGAAGFFGTLSVAAVFQISYAPYVSDYSRYLPRDTGPRQAFWASYVGCALGALFPMWLGALLGVVAVDGDFIQALARLTGPAGSAIVLVFAIGITTGSAMNLYCGALSAITLGQTFMPRWQAGSASRILIAALLLALSLFAALVTKDNFLADYLHFMDLLLCVMVPWTAVNLVDFYLVRFGEYDVPSFFTANGGVYGKYNWPALVCYSLGILVQVPFIASTLYTGPIAKALGGIDISWLVGLAVVSPLYYWAIRAFPGTATGTPSFVAPVPSRGGR